jgi:hypothetical protein
MWNGKGFSMPRRLRRSIEDDLRRLLPNRNSPSTLSLLFFVDYSDAHLDKLIKRFRNRNLLALWCMRGNVTTVADELGEYIGNDTIDVVLRRFEVSQPWTIHLLLCKHSKSASYTMLESIQTEPFSLHWFPNRQEISSTSAEVAGPDL